MSSLVKAINIPFGSQVMQLARETGYSAFDTNFFTKNGMLAVFFQTPGADPNPNTRQLMHDLQKHCRSRQVRVHKLETYSAPKKRSSKLLSFVAGPLDRGAFDGDTVNAPLSEQCSAALRAYLKKMGLPTKVSICEDSRANNDKGLLQFRLEVATKVVAERLCADRFPDGLVAYVDGRPYAIYVNQMERKPRWYPKEEVTPAPEPKNQKKSRVTRKEKSQGKTNVEQTQGRGQGVLENTMSPVQTEDEQRAAMELDAACVKVLYYRHEPYPDTAYSCCGRVH